MSVYIRRFYTEYIFFCFIIFMSNTFCNRSWRLNERMMGSVVDQRRQQTTVRYVPRRCTEKGLQNKVLHFSKFVTYQFFSIHQTIDFDYNIQTIKVLGLLIAKKKNPVHRRKQFKNVHARQTACSFFGFVKPQSLIIIFKQLSVFLADRSMRQHCSNIHNQYVSQGDWRNRKKKIKIQRTFFLSESIAINFMNQVAT